jgi:Ca2+-binding RTX toxin-like protein
VSSSDTDDYYKFSLGATNDFNLSLGQLNADAKVDLLDISGNAIASSNNLGIASESINRTLEHGTYYVRVSSVGGASTPYNLNLSVAPRLNGITTTSSNAPVYKASEEIFTTDNLSISPSTDISGPLINMDKFRATPRFAGIDGGGFATVIIDTGIDLNHPFFGPDSDSNGIADRIVYNYDFADGDANASDVNGHGSNVSSIATSQDSTHTGMAPGANIIHLKVFKNSGAGEFSYVEQALQWVVANATTYNIASVNMSLGDQTNYNTPQTLYGLNEELADLAARNVIVVSASGNSFFNYGSAQGVSYPSADPNSLSIGAVYDSNFGGIRYGSGARANTTGSDRITPFSQRHSTLTTVFAPGAPITGAGPTGGLITQHGTSQAAPHIAGIAVLAQQLAQRDLGRRLTPSEFANFLNSTGVTINDGDDEDDNVTNTGLNFKRVDMLALAGGIVGNNPPVVNRSMFSQSAALGFSQTGNAFTLAANTDTDPDPGDSINYSIALADFSALNESAYSWKTDLNGGFYRQPIAGLKFPEIPLPSWLTFNPATRTINLGATRPTSFNYWLKVTGTDSSGASVSEIVRFKSKSLGGFVIDSYIAGATVFFDANKNGVLDASEPSATTSASGEYELSIPNDTFDKNQNGELDPEEGNIVAFGGTDTATGLPLETPVTAPPYATVVTLLTSLVADLIDKGVAPETAQSLVNSSLSIPAEIDITDLDPIAATENNLPGGVATLAAMVKVQNFITQTAALIDGASSATTNAIVKAVVSAITTPIQSGTVLNLSNAATLEPIIQQAGAKIKQIDPSFNSQKITSITSQAATVMATANQRIDAAVSSTTTSIPEAVARVQQVALGITTQDFKAVGAGNKTISQVVTDNTGAALDSKIQAVILPVGVATPVVSGDADLGSNSPDRILGTNGDDLLTGDSANNVLMGMRGNDSLDGGPGNDSLFGGKDRDILLGGTDDDTLFGGRGADSLNGGDGNDILLGGKGDDALFGGLGSDTLTGGNGIDNFLLSTNSGIDTITDFEDGKDLLVLGGGLTFSQLSITQENSATFIRFSATGEILASLNGVSASMINAADFSLA